MSRADWSFLEHLLEEGQEYSTGIGRVWLTVLFLFRILVLGTAAESAWDDEQAGFVCNTLQPGCTAVCYDRAFPISHFRYFVLQIIFVSTPSIFFFGYVALRAGKEQGKKEEEEAKERQAGEGSGERNVAERDDANGTKDIAENKEKQENVRKRGDRKLDRALPEPPKLKGRLLCAYAFSILLKILLEVGFIVGLWLLYDGFLIAAKYECEMLPCPHTVDCFVSRPTEKSIFTVYTQVIATISLLLNVVELFHLLQLAVSHRLEKRYGAQGQYYLPHLEKATLEDAPELQREAPQPYNEESHVNLPGLEGEGEATRHPNPCESYGDVAIEVNWGTAEAGADLLPSYVNCMGAMRKTHSPRVHYKKPTTHHTEKKNTKAAHKGHLKRKHYV